MSKKRTPARRPSKTRAAARKSSKKAKSTRARKRRVKGPIHLAKRSLTIWFKTESDLGEQLQELSSLFAVREAGRLEGVAAPAVSCLSLIQALHIVIAALAPKAFNPAEKLGETYLLSQEREAFRARTVNGVTAKGCQIADTSVPIEESATHNDVVNAVRDNAHA